MFLNYKIYVSSIQSTTTADSHRLEFPPWPSADDIERKYNPRTREWDLKKIKSAKGYDYIPVLICKMRQRRLIDEGGVKKEVDLNQSDPALISATIAHVPPPPTKDIIARRSRFAKGD